jgi:glycosyltransferase involved in cell wall biosynthesis
MVVGCGRLAGERVFGKKNMTRKKAIILPNSVETQKFKFDSLIREEVRKELGIKGQYVVGLVGRLCPQKNQNFALKMFKKAHELNNRWNLSLVGTGEDEERIKQFIDENDMALYVKMLGRRSDVSRLYQGFDVFILPSVFEGFPVAAVEAMASGLPVLLSDTITDELKFGSAVQYLPLNNEHMWAEALYKISLKDTTNERSIRQTEVVNNGLDIKQTVHMLESIYLENE